MRLVKWMKLTMNQLPAPELVVYEIRDSEGNIMATGVGRLDRIEDGNMSIIDLSGSRVGIRSDNVALLDG
jgi:hypothetical protein